AMQVRLFAGWFWNAELRLSVSYMPGVNTGFGSSSGTEVCACTEPHATKTAHAHEKSTRGAGQSFIDPSCAIRDRTDISGSAMRLSRSCRDAKGDVVAQDPSRTTASSLDADAGVADDPRIALGIGPDARGEGGLA